MFSKILRLGLSGRAGRCLVKKPGVPSASSVATRSSANTFADLSIVQTLEARRVVLCELDPPNVLMYWDFLVYLLAEDGIEICAC